ncbi:MAG TPA: hypothetical protein VJM53_04300 [Burkholderiales bacterium]|nr:hypothetical protein [Burkholderiales bacterium]
MSSRTAKIIAAIFSVLPVSGAHALIYNVEFEGLIISSPHTDMSYQPLALGATISGTFFYDTAWLIHIDDQIDPTTGRGFGPIDLKIHSAGGGETWDGAGFAQFQLTDTEDFDVLLFNFFQHPLGPQIPAPPGCAGCAPLELQQISLIFVDQGPSTPFMTSVVFPIVEGWHAGVSGTLQLDFGNTDVVASLGNYTATVVPEPAEWAFMLAGLAFTGFMLKRRTRP